ncbi:hypothetical protein KIN20_031023 [Parelaphostrongylus tenuis]|uniref:Uncharacterized protein n=1 Tax=Parelaphostrongylus tenuis TaxID=148309 RepID=A0AAD5R685_PARTN|nr:hypothetical protein KIN20_031023 [Parelaphostrongylus tenuis]
MDTPNKASLGGQELFPTLRKVRRLLKHSTIESKCQVDVHKRSVEQLRESHCADHLRVRRSYTLCCIYCTFKTTEN